MLKGPNPIALARNGSQEYVAAVPEEREGRLES